MGLSKAPLEKELKYFLTKKDYVLLLKVSKRNILRTVKQTNFYFDNPSLELRKRRIGLRIRIENNSRCTFTVKEPSKNRSKKLPKLKIRKEWEVSLPFSLAKKLIKGKQPVSSFEKQPIQVLKQYFSKEQLDNIQALGAVKTVRTFVQADRGILLEIDKFKMFEKRFYELEVETEHPIEADRVVRALFKKHRISCRPITKSKLGRFLELWKKQKRY